MPTPLTQLADVQTIFGVNPNDSSQYALFTKLINEATAAILAWCHRSDFGVAQYTRVLSGNNTPELIVPDLPVQGATLTGTITSGSAVVTGLPVTGTISALNLFQCQSVMGPGIPQAAIISDASQIASGQITLGTLQNGVIVPAPATASGTITLSFGIALWKDDLALGGSAFGSFATGTLLVEGNDFYLDWTNGYGTTCDSGIIYNAVTYFWRPTQWTQGLITPQLGPPSLNVKVQLNAGYTIIPYDVQQAAELLIANARNARRWGQVPSSMSNDMSVSFMPGGKIDAGLFSPPIRSLLAPYVITPVPNA